MFLQFICTILALMLYDLLKKGYNIYILKKNKGNLQKILNNTLGELIYSDREEEDYDKHFWED